jgi:hypothetical protein
MNPSQPLRRTAAALLFLLWIALPLWGAPAAGPAKAAAGGVDWIKTVEAWKNLVTIAGALVGGAWTYLKFFRGRTFSPRLELAVAGKLVVDPGDPADADNPSNTEARCLLATLSLKNVGLSKVGLDREVTRIEVSLYERAAFEYVYAGPLPEGEEVVHAANWGEPHRFRVFTPHAWVEPGETITDQILVTLPAGDYLAYRLTFVAASPESEFTPSLDWTATCIVLRSPPHAPEDATEKKEK